MWKTIEYATTGRGHRRAGIPCQDKVRTFKNNEVTVVALSDGAGSAKLSHFGAEAVLEAVGREIAENFDVYFEENDGKTIRLGILDKVRDALMTTREKLGCAIKDLSSTLLLAAVSGSRYFIIHIGDGVIGCLKNGEIKVISTPENGNFANETYFTTSPSVLSHMRIMKGDDREIHGFVLMSDGTENALYNKKTKELSQGIKKIMQMMILCPERTMQEMLKETFEDGILNHTADDCSISVLVDDIAFPNYDDMEIPAKLDLLQISEDGRNRDKRLRRTGEILRAASGGASAMEIVRKIHIKSKYVHRKLDSLVDLGLLEKNQGIYYSAANFKEGETKDRQDTDIHKMTEIDREEKAKSNKKPESNAETMINAEEKNMNNKMTGINTNTMAKEEEIAMGNKMTGINTNTMINKEENTMNSKMTETNAASTIIKEDKKMDKFMKTGIIAAGTLTAAGLAFSSASVNAQAAELTENDTVMQAAVETEEVKSVADAQQEADTKKEEYEKAEAAVEEAQTKVDEAQKNADEMAETAENLKTEVEKDFEDAKSEAASADEAVQKEVESAEQEVKEAEEKVAEAESEVSAAEDGLEDAEGDVNEMLSDGSVTEEDVTKLESDISDAKTEIETAKTELETRENELSDAGEAKENAEKTMNEAQDVYEAAANEDASADTVVSEAEEAVTTSKDGVTEAEEAKEAADEAVENAQEAVDKAKEDAEEAVDAGIADAEKDVADKQAAVETTQSALDSASENYKQGTLGLIDWMLAKDDLTKDQQQDLTFARNVLVSASEEDFSKWEGGDNTGLPEERNGKVISIGDEKDATNLENLLKSIEIMKKINELRASDDNYTGDMQRNASYTNFYFMATAEAGAMRGAGLLNHSLLTTSCEDLAFGYSDPTVGWYTKEKAIFDRIKNELGITQITSSADVAKIEAEASNQGVVVGHYTNLLWAADQVMGVGYTQYRYTSCYNASAASNYTNDQYNRAMHLYTIDEFEELVKEYYQTVDKSSCETALENAKTELSNAETNLQSLKDGKAAAVEAAIEQAKAELATKKSEAQQAEENLSQAKETLAQAEKALDEAMAVKTSATQKRENAMNSLNSATEAYNKANDDCIAAEQARDEAKDALADAESKLESLTSGDSAAAKLAKAMTARDEAKEKLRFAEDALANAEDNLTHAEESLVKAKQSKEVTANKLLKAMNLSFEDAMEKDIEDEDYVYLNERVAAVKAAEEAYASARLELTNAKEELIEQKAKCDDAEKAYIAALADLTIAQDREKETEKVITPETGTEQTTAPTSTAGTATTVSTASTVKSAGSTGSEQAQVEATSVNSSKVVKTGDTANIPLLLAELLAGAGLVTVICKAKKKEVEEDNQ